MARKINSKRFLKEDKGQASTLPILLKCINGIKKDNLNYSKLIGRDIFDIDYDNEDIDEIMDYNYGELYRELFMDRYYLYKFSDSGKIGICNTGDIDSLIEELAIKEGVNCYRNTFGIVIVAYYGNYTEKLYLIPISEMLYSYISKAIDESDFDESDTINAMLSQYAYNESYNPYQKPVSVCLNCGKKIYFNDYDFDEDECEPVCPYCGEFIEINDSVSKVNFGRLNSESYKRKLNKRFNESYEPYEDIYIEYGVENDNGIEKYFETKEQAIRYAKDNYYNYVVEIIYYDNGDNEVNTIWSRK